MAPASLVPRLFLLLAFLGFLAGVSEAHKNHVVGGSFGWKIPPNLTFYKEWAATKTFVVGDRLVFLYRSGAQNVLEVSAEDYKRCGSSNVTNMYYIGPTIVELETPGPHFFYSGVGLHCEAGQKLAVDVGTTAPPPPFVADESLYSIGSDDDTAQTPAPSPVKPVSGAATTGIALLAALSACLLHASLV
ncbi:hypothetical protein HPP92_007439 [Vanilla planifolia]|uniref:Phytocyanin domain-containing protein n=1 Tax=Vanilla planifolia TaxID=51239 RepID=A0A835RKG1_VANPL|nr:hypothetical protein HPP92_007439 [Vanilla planifolia]